MSYTSAFSGIEVDECLIKGNNSLQLSGGNITNSGFINFSGTNGLNFILNNTDCKNVHFRASGSAGTKRISLVAYKDDGTSTFHHLINEKGERQWLVKSDLLNLVYPVGAVYISYDSRNPGSLFGGTWQQIEGAYLYPIVNSEGYSAGSTFGNWYHSHTAAGTALTIDQIPSHYHAIKSGYSESSPGYDSYRYQYWGGSSNSWKTGDLGTSAVGGGATHTHTINSSISQPPSIRVYMWRRVG